MEVRLHIKFEPWPCADLLLDVDSKLFRKRTPEEQDMFLPKVDNAKLPGEVMASTNTQVGESTSEIEPGRKPAKVTHHSYSDETRASIGKYPSLHGPAAAVRHFSGISGHAVPESTVRKL